MIYIGYFMSTEWRILCWFKPFVVRIMPLQTIRIQGM